MGNYKGDIGQVFKINKSIIYLVVVPRIDFVALNERMRKIES
jgi:hypothetical protein